MTKLQVPVSGIQPAPDVSLTELEQLMQLVDEEAEAELSRLRRDLRLARSLHTFYGPSAARPPERLMAAALRKFGERTRLV